MSQVLSDLSFELNEAGLDTIDDLFDVYILWDRQLNNKSKWIKIYRLAANLW